MLKAKKVERGLHSGYITLCHHREKVRRKCYTVKQLKVHEPQNDIIYGFVIRRALEDHRLLQKQNSLLDVSIIS